MIKRGSTNALLQKAQSQLRGEKLPKANEEEDDINVSNFQNFQKLLDMIS